MFHWEFLLLKSGKGEINTGHWKAKAETQQEGVGESVAWGVREKWGKKKFFQITSGGVLNQ